MANKREKSTSKISKKLFKESSVIVYLMIAVICLIVIGAIVFLNIT